MCFMLLTDKQQQYHWSLFLCDIYIIFIIYVTNVYFFNIKWHIAIKKSKMMLKINININNKNDINVVIMFATI